MLEELLDASPVVPSWAQPPVALRVGERVAEKAVAKEAGGVLNQAVLVALVHRRHVDVHLAAEGDGQRRVDRRLVAAGRVDDGVGGAGGDDAQLQGRLHRHRFDVAKSDAVLPLRTNEHAVEYLAKHAVAADADNAVVLAQVDAGV